MNLNKKISRMEHIMMWVGNISIVLSFLLFICIIPCTICNQIDVVAWLGFSSVVVINVGLIICIVIASKHDELIDEYFKSDSEK